MDAFLKAARALALGAGLSAVSLGLARAAGCDPDAVAAITAPSPRPEFRPERIAEIDKRAAAQQFDALAFGDSLLEGWREADLTRAFGAPALDVGFGMDGAEQILWRLERFDWSKQHPKYVLALVGNNDMHFPACAVDIGLAHLIGELRRMFPAARLIVTSVFPRGRNFLDKDAAIRAVNATLAAGAKRGGYAFFDIYPAFTCGRQPTCDLYQAPVNRHLTAKGYTLLNDLLQKFVAAANPKPGSP